MAALAKKLRSAQPTATVTVTDDDAAEPVSNVSVSISADVESIPEGSNGDTTTVTYTITASEPLERDARVIIDSTGGNDPLLSEPLDILAGQQTVIFTNEVSGDDLEEDDEILTGTIDFAAFNAPDGSTGEEIAIAAQPTATVTVTDDDGGGETTTSEETLSFSISADADVIPEGNNGDTTTVTYTVDAGQPLERDARVIIESTGGNNPLTSEPLSIPAGEQTVTFTNEITGDNEAEPSEILTGTVSFAAFNAEDGSTGEEIPIGDNNTARVAVSDDDGGNDIVYRFFNPSAGVHFYTDDENERVVVDTLDNYNAEGASYRTVDPLTGDEAGDISDVYRFFNPTTGVHLYTTDERERDFIIENNDTFAFEGTAFSAYETEVEGSIPIYRFFEPTIGVHFYTPNEGERENVENNLPNYDSEGIAYYALPLDGGADV